MTWQDDLNAALELNPDAQVERLVHLGNQALSTRSGELGEVTEDLDALVSAMSKVISDGIGRGHERLALGEVLGRLGDPRLRRPSDADYWARIELDDGVLLVGRFPVTTTEFRSFIAECFHDDSNWSGDGIAWRKAQKTGWPELARNPELAHLIVGNQPVVGVTWFEAEAYGMCHGARLPTSSERQWIVRGEARRPYPWGQPFGSGKANTREEALKKPSAVGLFPADTTPDGVSDLAGNAAEWLDGWAGDNERLYHPGSWNQPSMASWAKALQTAPADVRSSDLGFRIVRDA